MGAIATIRESTHFSVDEFPELVAKSDPELIRRADAFRDKWGKPVHPSRWVSSDGKRSGFARLNGSKTSRHYAVDRLADAGDFFPEGDVMKAMLLAFQFFGAVGIYYDTKRTKYQPGPMLHFDLREDFTFWCRFEGRYIYPNASQEDREEFWALAWKYAEDSL